MKDDKMAENHSKTRARHAIKKLIDRFKERVREEHRKEMRGADGEGHESDVLIASKAGPDPSGPSGIEIISSWKDPDSGEWFSLAVLKLEIHLSSKSGFFDWSQEERKYYQENALRIFKMMQPECK
jgi:hypothetical protein